MVSILQLTRIIEWKKVSEDWPTWEPFAVMSKLRIKKERAEKVFWIEQIASLKFS